MKLQQKVFFDEIKERANSLLNDASVVSDMPTVWYGSRTPWWTDDPNDLQPGPMPMDSLGFPLYQGDLKEFIKRVEAHPDHYGAHGLTTFMAMHHKNFTPEDGDFKNITGELNYFHNKVSEELAVNPSFQLLTRMDVVAATSDHTRDIPDDFPAIMTMSIEQMRDIPDTIYLTLGDDDDLPESFDELDTEFTFWSTTKEFDNDIEYRRVVKEQARVVQMSVAEGRELRPLSSLTDDELKDLGCEVFLIEPHLAWMEVSNLRRLIVDNEAFHVTTLIEPEDEPGGQSQEAFMEAYEFTAQTMINLTRWLDRHNFEC